MFKRSNITIFCIFLNALKCCRPVHRPILHLRACEKWWGRTCGRPFGEPRPRLPLSSTFFEALINIYIYIYNGLYNVHKINCKYHIYLIMYIFICTVLFLMISSEHICVSCFVGEYTKGIPSTDGI